MKANRQQLLNQLNQLKPGLAAKELIEQSTCFVFAGGRAYTYNDEIAVSIPTEIKDIEGAVPAKELVSLLQKSDNDDVDLEMTDAGLVIKSGRYKSTLSVQSEIRLPINEIQTPDKWQALPGKFIEAVKFCLFSVGKDMTKPLLTCIHCFDTYAESCDRFRLTSYYYEGLMTDSILIPGNAAQELCSFAPTHYAILNGWLHFKCKDALFSCRTYANAEYPDLSPFLQMPEKCASLSFPTDMQSVLDRAGVFSETQIKNDNVVSVRVSENKMLVTASGDKGRYEEPIRIRYAGEPIQFEISPTILSEMLKLGNGVSVTDDKIKFECEDFVHVISLT